LLTAVRARSYDRTPMALERARSQLWHVALISSTALALELSFIREVPAEVRAISYFTNLIFMASFFGLGLGCLLERARRLDLLLPLGLFAVAAFVYFTRGLVVFERAEAVHYWLEHDRPRGTARDVPLFAAALVAFASTSLPFVAIGQRLARAMSEHARLRAYGWDIVGSLLGTLGFVLASALGVPPYVWPLALMLLWASALLERRWPRILHIGAGALFLIFAHSPYPARWSPYYYIQYNRETYGLRVWVNSSFHQFAANLDPNAKPLAAFQARVRGKFSAPYAAYRAEHRGAAPHDVLVLGAGTGNDVNIARANGATRVVAVEIDPAILALGRELNATKPYADPRVHAVIDDARHYLRSTRERFDLIVFGTLDSQTLLSSQANLRLENYVYTREAFADVARRLRPTGMVAAYYSVFKPWLVGRLYRTICDNFPGHCQVLEFDPFLFDTIILAGPALPGGRLGSTAAELAKDALPATDDWPFLYVERPTVAPVYLQLMAAVFAAVVALFVGLRRRLGPSPPWSCLFFGVGFTLMESAALVRLALLFGSTWLVNAVVFSAVLATVFVGNELVRRGRAPGLHAALVALLAAVAIDYAITPSWFVGLAPFGRGLAAALAIGVPVGFAAVGFSRLFAQQTATGPALGLNLIGAMIGGFAEYASMLVGMRAVWLLIAAVYLAAWFCARRETRGSKVAAIAPQANAGDVPAGSSCKRAASSQPSITARPMFGRRR
jgi:hypothetical protein